MGEGAKLSDKLIADARRTAELAERSVAAQCEFWSRLGRAVELVLGGTEECALRNSGDAVPLSYLLLTVDSSAGRKRLAEYLSKQPFPHYQAGHGGSGMLVRVDADGTRTLGQFIDGHFVPREPQSSGSID
jgi:hypothetical protein